MQYAGFQSFKPSEGKAFGPAVPRRTLRQSAGQEKMSKGPKKIFDSLYLLSNLVSSMNILRPSIYAIALTSLALSSVNAQTTATTDPVGFMTVATPIGSDTIIGSPLTKAAVFQGAVTSRDSYTITSAGANLGDLTTMPHYVQATTGSQSGMIFDVASNTATTITLVDNGVAPTGFNASTQFKVIPYWTLGEIYPASGQNVSFTGSGTSGSSRRTQILLPNIAGTGINRSPDAAFFFVTNSDPNQAYWRKVGGAATNFNNQPLLPDSYFIVRNATNSGQSPGLATTVVGSVNTGSIAVPLESTSGAQNDNYVSLGRPVDITLNQLGLIASGAFTPSAGTSGSARRDQLLIFNNASVGQNKSPSAAYYYVSTASTNYWAAVGSGTADVGNTIIPAATGYIIRKASQNPTGTAFWTNTITLAD